MRAELIQHVGSDLTVVNAARVSFDKQSSYEYDPINGGWYLNHRDQGLISYLAKHVHFTPFTHCTITLRETVPIFAARQRFKHVVGFTYNEVSRRYVNTPPEFYVPSAWRKAAKNKKQGSSDEIIETAAIESYNVNGDLSRAIEAHHTLCQGFYEELLAAGVCPEQARMVLPQSMMTTYYVTGSLMAFARAYQLRTDPHAQYEIQLLAKEWDRIIRPLFPISWEALTNG